MNIQPTRRLFGVLMAAVFSIISFAGTSHATLLWDGNATGGVGVFKLLDLEDENGVAQNNPSTNGSSVTVVSDPIYGKVWLFNKAINDLRCEAHGANGVNPAIGSTYYIGWRTKFELPTAAGLNAIFQWKAYGEPLLQNYPITIAPGGGNLNLNEFNPNGAGGQTFLWSTPLITNVWNQHVLCISVSDQDYGGYIEYWYNGVQQTFNTGSNQFFCRTFDGTSVDPKWGAYGGDIYTVYDYVCGLKIGTTYADVVDTLYAFTASPPLQYTGLNGTNLTYTINLVTNPGFAGAIHLSLSGLPANTGYTLSPTNFTGPGTATLSVMTSNSTPQGYYILLISGINGSQTNYYTVAMNVAKAPATYVWNGPGSGSNDWSAGTNWSPTGPPTPIDTVEFFNPGAVSAVSNVNNFVDASFGGTIAALQFGNTNNNHTTAIAAGQTLNVTGGLTVGTETDNGASQAVFTTMTGAGGMLALNTGSDLVVRQGTVSSGGSQRATLDLSGLGNFNASVGRILVGVVGTVPRATGTLYLGATNNISTFGATPQICVGDNSGNGGGQDILYLGQTNSIFAYTITVGREKAAGTLAFSSRFANPSAYFRDSDGMSPVNLWSIGDGSAQSTSSSTSNGTNDFTLGTADILANTFRLGVSQSSTGATSTGVLTFSSGTINVNALQIGVQSASGATSAGVGHVNVNSTNAVLIINSSATLGMTSGGTGTTNTYGTLNINGGNVSANSILAGALSGPNSLAVNGGTLVLTNTMGTPASPIYNLIFSNAAIHLNINGSSRTNIVATTTTAIGTTVISIDSITNITLPKTVNLISYTGSDPFAGLTLGTLPAGYAGSLVDNHASGLIALSLSNAPPPISYLAIKSFSLSGMNLIINGTNQGTGTYYVLMSTNLANPLSQWTPVATNSLSASGNFALTATNAVFKNAPQQFYILSTTNK